MGDEKIQTIVETLVVAIATMSICALIYHAVVIEPKLEKLAYMEGRYGQD